MSLGYKCLPGPESASSDKKNWYTQEGGLYLCRCEAW